MKVDVDSFKKGLTIFPWNGGLCPIVCKAGACHLTDNILKSRLVSATSIVTFIYGSFTMVGAYLIVNDLFSAGFKIKSCITLGEFSKVDLSVLGYYFASLTAFFSWYAE